MRYLSILLLLLIVCSCKANYELIETDSPDLIGIKSNKFRGTIFKDSYPFKHFYVSDIDSTKRFIPTKKDIAEAERILKEQIKGLNKSKTNQFGDCPVIHRNLSKYFRQYVGFYDTDGNKMIHINFLWDRHSLKDRLLGYAAPENSYNDDYATVFDGCSNYWQVNINLTTKKASDLQVNGVA